MTGVAHAVMGGSSIGRGSVTLTNGGGGYITHSGTVSLRGVPLKVEASGPPLLGYNFHLITTTTGLSQNWFSRIVIQDASGALQAFTSASATEFNTIGGTSWEFGDGSSPLWTSADVGEVKTFYIVF